MATVQPAAGQPVFLVQGMSFSTFEYAGYKGQNLLNGLAEAKRDGANYVELSNQAYVDLATGAIGEVIQNGVNRSAPFEDMAPAIVAAKALGLGVMLKPQLVYYDTWLLQFDNSPYGNLTNESLAPSDPAKFFAGYKAYILKWAALAEQYQVGVLSIGNEMSMVTKASYTPYWNDIIDAVRQVYHGQLTYSALSREITQVGFWQKLDIVGIDVYPNLTNKITPTVSEMTAAWMTAREVNPVALAAFAANVGKPILFTESGMASYAGANDRQNNPSTLISNPAVPVDLQTQANYWASFFEVWGKDTPAWLMGVFSWNSNPSVANPAVDNPRGFEFFGKPAEQIISAWFGGETYVGVSQRALTGTAYNDDLFLFGVKAGEQNARTQAASFATEVSIRLTASVINGQAPKVHLYAGSTDLGVINIQPTIGFVDAQGRGFTAQQTFTYSLPGLTALPNIRAVFESPVDAGNGQLASVYFRALSVNGVALSDISYTPLSQYGQTRTQVFPGVTGVEGTSQQTGGGATVFGTGQWNVALTARAIGSTSDPYNVVGGGGADALHLMGSPSQYTIAGMGGGEFRLTESAGLGQNAVINGVSSLVFADGASLTPLQLIGSQIAPVAANILRVTSGPAVATLIANIADGVLNPTNLNAAVVRAADATSSVATLTYEFFTGKIPSAGGMDYLLSPAVNPNSLNSPYYQSFSLENRYINFAVNLGKLGEGAASFSAAYGSKSMIEATKAAYATIFGSAPTDAKAHALIDSRIDYFAYYGGDGPNGIGTKAAIVGWLLGEAVKADIGTYARSNDAFLTDLADGASFSVDLVGVYGKPEFAFLG